MPPSLSRSLLPTPAPAMNCADDLTQVDVEHALQQGTLASTSSSSSQSLFPFIDFARSNALNVDNADDTHHLRRVLRPLDSKDTVLDNHEIVGTLQDGTEQGGHVWSAGCIDTQDGDDELLIHVRPGPRLPRSPSVARTRSPPSALPTGSLLRAGPRQVSPPLLCQAHSLSSNSPNPRSPAPRSILIGTGGGRLSTSPRLCRAWVNRGPSGIDFDEASAATPPPAQDFELLESEGGGRGAVEYPVRITKFANVSDVSLYFVRALLSLFRSFSVSVLTKCLTQANARGEQSRLYFLGFLGESRQLKKEPGEPMTSASAPLLSHLTLHAGSTDANSRDSVVGAENAAPSMVDGVKEKQAGASTTTAR